MIVFCECSSFFFFLKDTATTEIYTDCHTLSLHDALPIYGQSSVEEPDARRSDQAADGAGHEVTTVRVPGQEQRSAEQQGEAQHVRPQHHREIGRAHV